MCRLTNQMPFIQFRSGVKVGVRMKVRVRVRIKLNHDLV